MVIIVKSKHLLCHERLMSLVIITYQSIIPKKYVFLVQKIETANNFSGLIIRLII